MVVFVVIPLNMITKTTLDDYDDNFFFLDSNYIKNRKRSLSIASQSRGRVRNIVDTLERLSASSSEKVEEGNWTGRNKDTTLTRQLSSTSFVGAPPATAAAALARYLGLLDPEQNEERQQY